MRGPLVLLAAGAVGSAVLVLSWLVFRSGTLRGGVEPATRIGPICAALFGYIRWVYVARTRLAIDASGVALKQPLASWHMAWADLSAVNQVSAFTPTHRAGLPAAIKLVTKTGQTHTIPDIFRVKAEALKAMITQASLDSADTATHPSDRRSSAPG